MLWIPTLALLLLPFTLVSAALDAEQDKLVKLAAAGNGVIKLDEATFNLLTHPERTWSAAIQFTAMDSRRKCIPCNEFRPSWNTVAKAWAQTPTEHRNVHFFATIDFDDAQTVFQRLNLMSAPVVSVYPAAAGPRRPASGRTDPAKYDFTSGFDPAPLAEQLSHHTPIPIPYQAPINWGKIFTTAFSAATFLLFARFFKPVLTGRLVWIIMTVVPSLAFMGGLMFVQIRASPWQMSNGQWLAQGYSNQFGKEVQMIAIIYGSLAGAFLALVLVTPFVSPARQRIQIYSLILIIAFIYSSLLSLFRFKNRGLYNSLVSPSFR